MKSYIILFSVLFNLLNLPSALATTLLPVTLEQLSTRAPLIFYGEVISNQVKKDEQSGYIATFTEFKVIDLIKGNTADTHTIKQIGGLLKNSNTALRIHGVPEYQVGKSYVVFLPAKSTLGFSSPLGLHQGSFSVSTINEEQHVSNGRSLASQPLAKPTEKSTGKVQLPLAVRADNPSLARLNDFINTVRAYNAQ